MEMIEKVVNVYKSVTRFPTPVFAEVLKSDGNFISVLSRWSQSNVETGKKVSSQQIYLLSESPLAKVQEFPPVDTSHEVCSSLSPCGTLKAVIRESAATATKTSQQFLEIWHGHQMQLNSNLTSLDIHGSVYAEGDFTSLVWAPSGEKVAYIAEEKVAKSEPFIPFKKPETESSKPITRGEQFALRPDWGEQLVGRSQPVVVVCDVKPGSTPTVLTGLPENLSPGQLTWTHDSSALIGVAWENNPRRLGLIYCTNRPGHIFHLTLDGAYKNLSSPDVAVRSPRCSPDGSQVIWLERKTGGPHHGGMKLMSYHFASAKIRTVVDIVEDCETLASGEKFYGLYCTSLPRRCWTNDGHSLILNTPQVDKVTSYLVNLDTGKVVVLDLSQGSEESRAVLDVWRDVVVCVSSSMRQPHSLFLGKLDLTSNEPQISYTPLTSPPDTPDFNNLVYHSFILEASPSMNTAGDKFGALYMGPPNSPARTVPLIVWPHGGPHSMFACDFKAEASFFVLLGFGVLMVNYRGSIGFGEASVKSLPGHIGDNDVADMQQAVKEALIKLPELDPDHCVLFGGSHGGFLVTHLSGQFPDAYRAVVARNPVTDIASMSCVSDIPDWSSVECGWEFSEMTPRSTEELVEMRRKSPLWHARNVKAPTLLLVGSNDLRVPPSQSLLYYHQLKGQGTPVKCLMYDDNHPLGKVPNDVDNIINSALWFLQHTTTQ